MATDEALLDSVAHDPRAAVFRSYSWSVPTLSLGYFQNYAEVEADPRWAGQALVRRATGGGALWHDQELTYAAVVPASHPLARPSIALYQAIHHAIGASLRTQGIEAGRRGTGRDPIPSASNRPFLCFLDRDADDVVVGRVKLAGSAQRRRSGAVLQHGSLLLRRSATTPELAGLGDLAAQPSPATEVAEVDDLANRWISIFKQSLPGLLGTAVVEEELTDWELDRADDLRRTIYETTSWTRRR